eukprot:m.21978 g.21978  ORF g.21978 m.21978 type:complete len:257 (+) comp6624_c0_seq1:167-937(+)
MSADDLYETAVHAPQNPSEDLYAEPVALTGGTQLNSLSELTGQGPKLGSVMTQQEDYFEKLAREAQEATEQDDGPTELVKVEPAIQRERKKRTGPTAADRERLANLALNEAGHPSAPDRSVSGPTPEQRAKLAAMAMSQASAGAGAATTVERKGPTPEQRAALAQQAMAGSAAELTSTAKRKPTPEQRAALAKSALSAESGSSQSFQRAAPTPEQRAQLAAMAKTTEAAPVRGPGHVPSAEERQRLAEMAMRGNAL